MSGSFCFKHSSAKTLQVLLVLPASQLHATPRGFQANEWEALSPGGSIPSVRDYHTAVWSDVADGFYVFGGYDGSRCLSGAALGNCCVSTNM